MPHDRIRAVSWQEMKKLDQELTQLSKAKRKDDEARDMIQKQILTTNIAHMEISRRGFDKIDDRLKETNTIAKNGFNKLDDSIQQGNAIATEGNSIMREGNEISKAGFSKVTNAVDKGSKSISEKIHKGNAIQAAIAKKEGINLHDESILQLNKKISKTFVGVTGKLTGKSSVEIEGDKLNV